MSDIHIRSQYSRKPTNAELIYGTYIEPEYRRGPLPEPTNVCGICGNQADWWGSETAKPLCRECDSFIESRLRILDAADFSDNFVTFLAVPQKGRRGLHKQYFEFDGKYWWQLIDIDGNRRPGIVKNEKILQELNGKLPRKPEPAPKPEWQTRKIPVDHAPKYLPGYDQHGPITYDRSGLVKILCDGCNDHDCHNEPFAGCEQHGNTCQLCGTQTEEN